MHLPADVEENVRGFAQPACTMLLKAQNRDGSWTSFATEGTDAKRIRLTGRDPPECRRADLSLKRVFLHLGLLLREVLHPLESEVSFDAHEQSLPPPYELFNVELRRKGPAFSLTVVITRRGHPEATGCVTDLVLGQRPSVRFVEGRAGAMSCTRMNNVPDTEVLLDLFRALEATRSAVRVIRGTLMLNPDGTDDRAAKLGLVQARDVFSGTKRRV